MKSLQLIMKYIKMAFIIMLGITCLSGCGNRANLDEENAYIVNIRSRKIHSAECQYVNLMNESNKLVVKDSLLNLLKKDYTICRKCRAGTVENSEPEIIDRAFHANLYVDDIVIQASIRDYLYAVDTMSEWYVGHVPTYAGTIQEEDYSQYSGKLTKYKEYALKNKGENKTYKALTDNEDGNSCIALSASDKILRANELAAVNYQKEFDNIQFKKKIAYYPCEGLISSPDYNTPGDDCVRYLFAVFNKMDSQFTEKYKSLTGYSVSNTNSKRLATDKKNIAFGMNALGFKIYDITSAVINVNSDSIPEGYIFKIENNFKLKKGDVIVRDGHVHVYLGDGYTVEADNFGWGRVYRSFPQKYDIQVKKSGDGMNYIVLTNSNGDSEYYTRVYRYVGNVE